MSRNFDVLAGLAMSMLGVSLSDPLPRDRVYKISKDMPKWPKKPKKPRVAELIGPPWPLTRQQKRAMIRRAGVLKGNK